MIRLFFKAWRGSDSPLFKVCGVCAPADTAEGEKIGILAGRISGAGVRKRQPPLPPNV